MTKPLRKVKAKAIQKSNTEHGVKKKHLQQVMNHNGLWTELATSGVWDKGCRGKA